MHKMVTENWVIVKKLVNISQLKDRRHQHIHQKINKTSYWLLKDDQISPTAADGVKWSFNNDFVWDYVQLQIDNHFMLQ